MKTLEERRESDRIRAARHAAKVQAAGGKRVTIKIPVDQEATVRKIAETMMAKQPFDRETLLELQRYHREACLITAERNVWVK